MKKENQSHRRTALICWCITFALTIYFRWAGNAFFTYLFGMLTVFFLVAASIFQSLNRKLDNAQSEAVDKSKRNKFSFIILKA